MKRTLFAKILLAGFIGTLIWETSIPSSATTFNTISVDCDVNIGPEWQVDENMGSGGMNTGTRLYITWDATYLYLGITPPFYLITIYIDTASGGTNIGSLSATHQIAGPSVGYEYAYSANDIGVSSLEVASGGTWISNTLPSETGLCSSGTGMEWAIPWTDIGVSPGSRFTILVTDRSQPDTVDEYWPDVPGNANPPPAFTQGFVFTQPMEAGVSPSGSPTAITLNRLTASDSRGDRALVISVTVILSAILAVSQRRLR